MIRFFKAFFLLLLGCTIAAFAVANRESVRFVLDPLSPYSDPSLAASVQAPLFVYLFIAMFIGMFLGAAAVWIGQGRWRKEARARLKEADLWKREAEKLKAGLQASSGTSMVAAGSRPLRALP
jgi:hypothetical protein